MSMQHIERRFVRQGEKVLSRRELILPSESTRKEVLDILHRAEKAGIGIFDAHLLSDVILTEATEIPGWNRKPEQWYWDQVKNGKVDKDAPKLPGSWVLIDRTERPNYKDGRQLHRDDLLASILRQLRIDKKILTKKYIPQDSRFGISLDELREVVLPEIAELLGVDKSSVRLPKEIEFNVLGNLKYPHFGQANTSEWLEDNFGDNSCLFGGNSGIGGLAAVHYRRSGDHSGFVAFRPLVVVSPKA